MIFQGSFLPYFDLRVYNTTANAPKKYLVGQNNLVFIYHFSQIDNGVAHSP
jgi:hypothetical protein